MRVGFFVGPIQPEQLGGGHVFQINVMHALMKMPNVHDLRFYYRSPGRVFMDDAERCVNLTHEPRPWLSRTFLRGKRRPRLNAIIKRDMIEFVYFLTPLYFETVEAPYAITVWDVAHRMHPYFPEVSTSGWTFDARERHFGAILPKAAYVVIGNQAGVDAVCGFYRLDRQRVRAIPMPTPSYVREVQGDDSILERNGLRPREYLFYPAQFWPHKNHVQLLKAMQHLADTGLKIVFTGSDTGNRAHVIDKAGEYGVRDSVVFPGFVDKSELVSLYRHAYAVTYASFFGPDNIPPLEAMALGCPVICSSVAGMPEQLGDCALYFDPTSTADVVRQVRMLADDSLRQSLTSRGRALAASRSPERYAASILQIIDEFAPLRECWSGTRAYEHL